MVGRTDGRGCCLVIVVLFLGGGWGMAGRTDGRTDERGGGEGRGHGA